MNRFSRPRPSRPRPRARLASAIAGALRTSIVNGTFTPGQRLPTHVQLEQRFHSTPPTVAKALGLLKTEGFIRSAGRQGLFVVDYPPHRYDYALVLPTSPATTGGELWSRFYATLVNQAAALTKCGPQRIVPFFGMDNGVLAADYPALLQRVQTQRLAGIIFATPPFRLEQTPILDQPGISRVGFMTDTCPQFPQVRAVALGGSPANGETSSYWQKALDYLAGRGRRRVAVLATALTMRSFDALLAELQPLLAARGLRLHPSGAMAFGPLDAARVYAQALLQPRPTRPPDAMIITDDNLVESTVTGLLAAGVQVGTDLDIVAHCNFPWTGSSAVPVKRLGFDARTVLQRCMELIDRQRRGEPVPAVTTIEAKFEEEQQPVTGRDLTAQLVGTKGTR